ncbi:histidine kinase [Nocardioides fonticola]|uniref:histidine kinase n=1 Tax=Nocardioides fonticola TaxID=450363 RepID=A0ABP7XDQ9_9ACTN
MTAAEGYPPSVSRPGLPSRSHPRVLDLAVALAVLPTVVPPPAQIGGSTPFLDRLDAPGIALVLAACALLMLRRVAPWPTTLAVGTLVLVALARQPAASQAVVPLLVVLYTLGTRARVVAVAVTTAVLTGAVVATLLVAGQDTGEAGQRAIIPWLGLAAAVGVAIRGQRDAVAAAEARAEQAEQNREEEAQRRVAEERLRIARDLHDVLAHQVAVVNVQAGLAQHLLATDPTGAAEALGHVRAATGQVLRELPAFLGVLRAEDGDPGTAPAPTIGDVDDLVHAARLAGLQVDFRTSGDPGRLGEGTGLAAYRILQEALTNAVKHGAGSVEVHLGHGPTATVVEVVNAIATTPRAGTPISGHGLTGIRERAHAHGGTAEIGPADGRWRVRVALPTEPGRPDGEAPA